MSTLEICTLVLEYNQTESISAVGSVWLYCGDGSRDLAVEAPLDTLPRWHKIVGPIGYDVAHRVHSSLKAFFTRCRVHVIDEGIAD